MIAPAELLSFYYGIAETLQPLAESIGVNQIECRLAGEGLICSAPALIFVMDFPEKTTDAQPMNAVLPFEFEIAMYAISAAHNTTAESAVQSMAILQNAHRALMDSLDNTGTPRYRFTLRVAKEPGQFLTSTPQTAIVGLLYVYPFPFL